MGKQCGNIAIEEEWTSATFVKIKNQEKYINGCSSTNLSLYHTVKTFSIFAEKKINEEFALVNSRLKSYSNFPKSSTLDINILAEAGFFYTGHEEKVICFYCNGCLTNWGIGDNPWIEHSRWFPRCAFVLMNMPQTFKEKVNIILKIILKQEVIRFFLSWQVPSVLTTK